ncbi:splicing factor PWI domain-containing protein isoform X1 [Iris pallida]|uniref:Splicing factor PWI domain-containing protein isoform X1 n=1 Tax=Iris pallida TaxID=29817 RepID=A0AAX6FQW9_IRIPA|nr:splicing factor PWI domain-containing protein isoform X1 [Iris pallida]
MESRIFRELFWWCWDYFGGFLWTIFGWKIFAGICWRTSQFWVCPEIEEVLPNFLQKLYFIDFKLAFENEFPKPISGDDRTGLWAPAKCKRTGPTGR